MSIRYRCTVRPHERELLTLPPRTPFCCGRPMKRVEEADDEPDGGPGSRETAGSTTSG